MMPLVDTNVLVYAAQRDASEHALCRAILESLRKGAEPPCGPLRRSSCSRRRTRILGSLPRPAPKFRISPGIYSMTRTRRFSCENTVFDRS